MIRSFFAIHAADAEVVMRGRLLKGAALIMWLGIIGSMVQVVVHNTASWVLLSLMGSALITALVWLLAHRGHVALGGGLLAMMALVSISLTSAPADLLNTTVVVSYFIPILIAGLSIGATAVVGFSLLTVVNFALISALSGEPWSPWTTSAAMTLLISSALLWLILRSLEQTIAHANAQNTALVAAQQSLIDQRQSLLEANTTLSEANQQMTALLDLVRDLETPIIPLLAGVLVVPLVGQLDSARITRIEGEVLQAVYAQRAHTVIVDITGINTVDTLVARHLQHLARAVRLMGTRVMLTGIRSTVARTMVSLGLDFSELQTANRLEDGVLQIMQEYNQANGAANAAPPARSAS